MRTLDPGDLNYRPDYKNGVDDENWSTSRGFNYHQGPEWVWPVGYYLRAKFRFAEDKARWVVLPSYRPAALATCRPVLWAHPAVDFGGDDLICCWFPPIGMPVQRAGGYSAFPNAVRDAPQQFHLEGQHTTAFAVVRLQFCRGWGGSGCGLFCDLTPACVFCAPRDCRRSATKMALNVRMDARRR